MAGLLGPLEIRRRQSVDESDPLAGLHLDQSLLAQGMEMGQPIAMPRFAPRFSDPQQPAEPTSPTTTQPQKTSEPATTRAPQQTSKVGDILDSLTGGHFAARRDRNAALDRQAITQQRQDQAYQQQQARLAEIERLASGLTGPERQLYLQDPEKYADVLKSRHEAVTMDGGDLRHFGQGGDIYQAPKLVDDGGVYGTQTVDGYSQTGQRTLTEAEKSEMAKREADIEIARGQLGVSQGNLAQRRAEHAARRKAGGYGTPGIGGVVSPDDEDWELD